MAHLTPLFRYSRGDETDGTRWCDTMTPESELVREAQHRLSDLFGLYKAEWMENQLFELFTEPGYFGELRTRRPAVLIGGRGTGKTTVLKGLSYEGQLALSQGSPEIVREWDYYGIYYRVDTNQVTAFQGPEIEVRQWTRCFAHYMNLQLCLALLDFVQWYELRTMQQVIIERSELHKVCASLHLVDCTSLSELYAQLDLANTRFEAQVNNIADAFPTQLSLQKAPIDYLAHALRTTHDFKGKQFFFLLDEYENFLDYQQQVVNTIVKHAPPDYTFKVGVRELGWRERGTLNPHERLTHPADYARIDIAEEFSGSTFADFALRVCKDRLARSELAGHGPFSTIQSALPRLGIEDEATLLGVNERNRQFIDAVGDSSSPERAFVQGESPTMVFLMGFWSASGHGSPLEVVRDAMDKPNEWQQRHGNYAHALLFTMRHGKRGIRKYYAGWRVFLHLAGGNIRFLLELVHQSLLHHFQEQAERALDIPVDPKTQTLAAQQVGRKNLNELEGIGVEGAKLTKLLLGLGRVFEVLAEHPVDHAPEINQFSLAASESSIQEPAALAVDDSDAARHPQVLRRLESVSSSCWR